MAEIATATRFDGSGRLASAATLAALLCAILLSLAAPTKAIQTGSSGGAAPMSDPQLYQHVIDSVASGENYYNAIAHWHREGGFPLKPFVTVRMPTLAVLSTAIGITGKMIAIALLILAVVLAWRRRLGNAHLGRLSVLTATGLIAVSAAMFIIPVATLFHESWAALLIALSLALRRPEKFAASIIMGLAAALIRELALGYLVLMLCIAAYEWRWREATGWLAAIALFGIALALHARGVAAVVQPSDLASQGWNTGAGWPLYVSATASATPLIHLPEWVARIVIPLCFFGWWSSRFDLSLRVVGMLAGYAVMIMLFARPNTFYWGMIAAPLLLAGLAFVPAGLARHIKGISL
jgi:hypothetical protein